MRKFIAAVFAAMVAVVGLSVPANADPTTVTVRESDVDLSQTRATGHNDFLREGVHIWTESNTSTDKAAGYYPVGTPIDDVDSVSQRWVGSEPQPGLQLVVDNGYGDDTGAPDGVPDGILVWEPVYGGTDVWLTNGSSQALKDAAEDAGMTGGGSGSNWHGTLQQWQDVVPNNTVIMSAGWSLGSGIKGDGVLFAQTVGETTYEFTSDVAPLPVAKPTVTATGTQKNKSIRVKVFGEQPEGTQPTAKGAYYRVVKINPRTDVATRVGKGRVHGGEMDVHRVRFPNATKNWKVRVISYGQNKGTFWYNPNK